jgi:hypothetical protein
LATLQHNITTILTKNLLTAGDDVSNAKSITIANVDSSNDAVIDLFLNKGSENYYILKGIPVPNANTLILSPEDGIIFDNGFSGFSLRIQVDNGSGVACDVDVIIKD